MEMKRLGRWQFWICLLLAVPPLMVAQTALRSERQTAWAEQVSSVANVLPAALFILAAVLILKPVGVRIALGASLMTCALLLVGMQYTVGLEAALVIYALASVGFGASILFKRKRPDAK